MISVFSSREGHFLEVYNELCYNLTYCDNVCRKAARSEMYEALDCQLSEYSDLFC